MSLQRNLGRKFGMEKAIETNCEGRGQGGGAGVSGMAWQVLLSQILAGDLIRLVNRLQAGAADDCANSRWPL